MYRMYVDETGNADLRASDDPNHRFLSLTGIIISLDVTRDFVTPELDRIKREVFDNHDPDVPLILHRKEIIQKRHPFEILRKPEKEQHFNGAILGLMQAVDFVAVTVVIDKKEHLERYVVWRQNPYHYCMEILVERYVLWLRKRGGKGDIVAEARGAKENDRLCACVEHFHEHGTAFVKRDDVQSHLTSRRLKIKHKHENVSGLQIADLIAHPSYILARCFFLNEPRKEDFGAKVTELLLTSKYHRSYMGQIRGYGLKWLP